MTSLFLLHVWLNHKRIELLAQDPLVTLELVLLFEAATSQRVSFQICQLSRLQRLLCCASFA